MLTKKLCIRILLLGFLFSFNPTFSEDTKEIIGLKQKLTESVSDSAKIKTLLEISIAYRQSADKENCKKYAEEALIKAKAANLFISDSKRVLALAYRTNGDNEKTLALLGEALVEARKEKSKKAEGDVYNDFGTTYYKNTIIDSSLNYLIKAVKIREQIADTSGIASSSANIGLIYNTLNNRDKAMEYFQKALKMFRLKNQKFQEAVLKNNIGNLYKEFDKNYPEALKYFLEALEIVKKLNKKIQIAQFSSNIGNTYERMGMDDKAIKYLTEAVQLMEEIGDMESAALVYHNLAYAFYNQKKIDIALKYSEKSFVISKKLNLLKRMSESALLMSKCYELKGDYKMAYYYYREQDGFADSLAKMSNNEMVNKLGIEYETEKKELQIKNLESTQALDKAEAGRQKTQKLLLATGLVAALLLGVLFLYGFVQKRRDNKIIEHQKQKVEIQKELLEEKNKDITDSINYAKRIQQAILKSEEHESKHLPPHFILFKPKDIVSGDFYWALEKQGHLYLTAADCTGHGVPGALLTMLGTSFLNEINAHDKLLSTSEILDKLRERIIKELKQTGIEGENKDGMDISICRLNLATKELQWSGANNPLYYIKNNEIKEIKADKQPIGYYTNMKPFTLHELQFKKGDSFYLLTDGFADQFGGELGKKFKYKQLQELLIKNVGMSQEKQKKILNSTFESWMGNLEQVDDVCLIGVTIA